MEDLKPCVGCGNTKIEVHQLGLDDRPSFFIKCTVCDSTCTIVHAVKNDAMKQWNNLWCWKEIERLEGKIRELTSKASSDLYNLTEDQRLMKYRLQTLMEHYIKHRLDYAGSFGNLSAENRRNLMIKEISAELGWVV